ITERSRGPRPKEVPMLALEGLRDREEEEALTVEKKKQTVIEQMMVDQLCRCGHEACRELIGFFFTCDHTLTVYEYRSFGKNRCNVLPFIARGVYKTRGRTYCLADFSKIFAGCISGAVCDRMRGHAIQTLTTLGRKLTCLDLQENGFLVKEKLRKCLMEDLSLSPQDFDTVWRIAGPQGEVTADAAAIMRAVTGEMSEARKAVFIKVYVKLDPHKTGSITLIDIEKFYWAKQDLGHGAKTDFLTCIRNRGRVGGKVSYAEFEDYYEGLSIEIPSDEEYISILTSTWSI
ncbi:hypothetical protein P4O66_018438, partial [Electrophorus voltai]